MPWWIWLIPIVGILIYLWRLRVGPGSRVRVPSRRLRLHVERFLDRSNSGFMLLVEREGTAGLIALKMTQKRDGLASVEMGIPEADWSDTVFDGVDAELSDAGFDTRVQARGGCRSVHRFFRATVSGSKRQLAAEVPGSLDVVADVLGWDADTLVMLHTETGWRWNGLLTARQPETRYLRR